MRRRRRIQEKVLTYSLPPFLGQMNAARETAYLSFTFQFFRALAAACVFEVCSTPADIIACGQSADYER